MEGAGSRPPARGRPWGLESSRCLMCMAGQGLGGGDAGSASPWLTSSTHGILLCGEVSL